MHILALLAAVAAPAAPGGDLFTTAPADEALAAARRDGRPVMIDVFATWCGPCQKLDKDVFPDPAVQREAAHFVAIKVDGETPDGERLVARHHVVGYPTVLFLDPAGEEIDRIFGYLAAPEFAAAMRDYRAGRNTVADLKDRLRSRPGDLQLTFDLGRRLAIRGERDEAERLLGRVRKADRANKEGLASQAMLVLGNYLHLRGGKRYALALETLTELRKTWPDSPEAKGALYPIARALHGLHRDAEALASLQASIDADPNDVGAYNAFAWFCFKEDVDRPRGIEVARAGLARNPKDAGLWDTLAELYHATGRRDEAIEAGRKAQEIDPADDYFRTQLAKYEKGAGAP